MSYWATEAAGNPLGGFNIQEALAAARVPGAGADNGGSVLINGKWVMPQFGNQRIEGQGENAYIVPGEPTEYWIADDMGNAHATINGGSAQYEGKPYHRVDAQGNYIGSNNYKDMGVDKFTGLAGKAAVAGMVAAFGAGIANQIAQAAASSGISVAEAAAQMGYQPPPGLETVSGADAAGFVGEAAWAPTAGAAPLEFGAGTATMGAGGSGLTGEVLSKAALDGTASFGANSIPGALDISALSAAATPAAAQAALTKIAQGLGYEGLTTSALSQIASAIPTGLLDSVPGLTNLLGPALALVGGITSGNAADKAAQQQADAAREALALQERMFNRTIELNEPFRLTGVQANNRLGDLTGISGRTGAEGYGSLNAPFNFEADPGYAFRQSEGQKELTRRLTAGGQLYSGKALKDSMTYNSGLAKQEYGAAFDRDRVTKGDTFNRLSALSGGGQVATGAVSSAGQQYGQTGSAAIQNAGDALAAGRVGRANALSDSIGQGYSMYQDKEMMDRVLRARGY